MVEESDRTPDSSARLARCQLLRRMEILEVRCELVGKDNMLLVTTSD